MTSQGGDNWDFMKKILILGAIVALLCMLMSCSASKLVRMAQKKDPNIFKTTTVRDTTFIETPVVEFVDKIQRDTLIEYKDGETVIRYRYNTLTDTLEIEADCPDNVLVTETTDTTIVTEERWIDRWKSIFIAIGSVILAAILAVFVIKRVIN